MGANRAPNLGPYVFKVIRVWQLFLTEQFCSYAEPLQIKSRGLASGAHHMLSGAGLGCEHISTVETTSTEAQLGC